MFFPFYPGRRRAPFRDLATEADTSKTARAKLPQAFRDVGGPTHMLFEELAVRAETDDMDSLASAGAVIMDQCVACHAMFRVNSRGTGDRWHPRTFRFSRCRQAVEMGVCGRLALAKHIKSQWLRH